MNSQIRRQWLLMVFASFAISTFSLAQQDLTALKSVTKEKELPLAYYQLATIYADSTTAYFNLDSAYHYLSEVDKVMKNLSDKEKEKAREEMKPPVVRLRREVTQKALAASKKINTVLAYDQYIEYYKKAEATEKEQAVQLRNQLVFSQTEASDTYEKYQEVLAKYGSSMQEKSPDLYARLEKGMFAAFIKQHSWSAYPQFAADHPQHLYVKGGLKERFEQMRTTNNPVLVEQFIANTTNMPFAALAIDSLASKVTRSDNLPAYERFVKRYATHSQVNQVWTAWYETYKKQHSTQVELIKFRTDHPDFPFRERLDADIKRSETAFYDSIKQSDDTKKQYQFIKLNPTHPKVDSVWLRIFKLELEKNPGLAGIEKFQQDYPDFPFPKLLKAKLQQSTVAKKPTTTTTTTPAAIPKKPTETKPAIENYTIYPFSDQINSLGEEFLPIMTADENTLYFCGQNREGNIGFTDVFVSYKANGAWTKPKLIKELSTDYEYEAPLAVSADGTELIIFKNGKLFNCLKTATGWTKPEMLPTTINRDNWQADPQITADGKAMLFASGPSNMGDNNIYVSLRQPDGTWGESTKLGPTINSASEDRSPFLHSDMETFYFSSAGRKDQTGRNDLDIYVCKRLNNTWTKWSEPVNLGSPLNTSGHDWGLKVSTDGKTVYFSSGRENQDIFLATLPPDFQATEVTTIQGAVKDERGKPVEAAIVWQNLDTKDTIQVTRSDPSGNFFATLPPIQGTIGYTIRHKDYLPVSGSINLREGKKTIVLKEPLKVVSVENAKATGAGISLNNLFFATNQYEILPTSYPELDLIAQIVQSNALNIEIQGFTDNVGKPESNQKLSQNRATAVRQYLIQKGCTPEKITARGFGETKPTASNNTEEGRAKNRRVEIKIKQ